MCGICFSVRQRCRRRRGTGGAAHKAAPRDTSASDDGVRRHVLEVCTGAATMRVAPIVRGEQGRLRVVVSEDDVDASSSALFARLVDSVQNRGPDIRGVVRRALPPDPPHDDDDVVCDVTDVQAAAAVLGLRGSNPVPQPYEVAPEDDSDAASGPEDRSFLMWNGEIFDGALCPPPWGSDTVGLARHLRRLEHQCAADTDALTVRQARFLARCVDSFERELEGPYGFLYYAATLRMAVFGRDPLGRHSLLTHLSLFTTPCDGVAPVTELELIVSSNGVQHAVQCTGDAAVHVSDVDHSGTLKRPRSHADAEDEEEDGTTGTEHGARCWAELPVTGLFALPLHRPLIADLEDAEMGSPVTLLHCPWHNTQYRVHPLLRTAIAPNGAAEEDLVSADVAARRGFYWQKDTAPPPQLPRALVERVQASAPRSNSDDDVWAHWCAVRYLYALSAAVHRRIDVARSGADDRQDAARRRPLCILFSGGIDCTVLAALAHYLLPPETPIELANVAFGPHPEQAPDRVAALRAMEELMRLPQPYAEAAPSWEREWRLVLVDVPHKLCDDTARILDLLAPRHTVLDLDIGTALWNAARGVGRMQVLRRSDLVTESLPTADDTTTVDTAHHDVHTNDVDAGPGLTLDGFSKHFRVHPAVGETRVAMRGAATTTPTTTAKFDVLVEVLVQEGRQGGGPETPVLLSTLGKEYGVFLQPHLAQHGYKKLGSYLNDATQAGVIAFAPHAPSKAVCLVRPDDCHRAAALPPTRWLRTRGMGRDAVPPAGHYAMHYQSSAKVMLLGMGADETLGGYTRYRRFFHRHGMRGARQELEKDFARLWLRNLGRDDRVTMDSGREPRFPYLDEGVLRTLEHMVAERYPAVRAAVMARATPKLAEDDAAVADEVLQRCIEPVLNFSMSAGEGDKRILRNVAVMLGLGSVTRLQKRAIQFGSRIAERRIKGTTTL